MLEASATTPTSATIVRGAGRASRHPSAASPQSSANGRTIGGAYISETWVMIFAGKLAAAKLRSRKMNQVLFDATTRASVSSAVAGSLASIAHFGGRNNSTSPPAITSITSSMESVAAASAAADWLT